MVYRYAIARPDLPVVEFVSDVPCSPGDTVTVDSELFTVDRYETYRVDELTVVPWLDLLPLKNAS